jgi:pyrimidine deaminase RibD-like protein
MYAAEPTIAIPRPIAATPARRRPLAPQKPNLRAVKRYVPPRGLVRRLTEARSDAAITALLDDHGFDPETGEMLRAALIKAGAPPLSQSTAAIALERLLRFEPLNADALRPFVLLAAERDLRAEAMGHVGYVMRQAGRTVRLFSDAADSQNNAVLAEAAARLGCKITDYNGSPHCAQALRETDLGCLNLIEAGYRKPLDRVALLRLTTLISAIDAEPVMVMRPQDAECTEMLAKTGVKRVILMLTEDDATLGKAIATLRRANLAVAEIIDRRDETRGLIPATPTALARHLLA